MMTASAQFNRREVIVNGKHIKLRPTGTNSFLIC
jgi:hypothetical protein